MNMQQIEFRVPPKCDLSKTEALIERICAAHGLTVAMKGSLTAVQGSVHWHYKQPKQKGTLELTLVSSDRRIWAQIHTNRNGPWIDDMLPQIRKDIEQALSVAAKARPAAARSPRRLQ
jgi:hypothetical protein